MDYSTGSGTYTLSGRDATAPSTITGTGGADNLVGAGGVDMMSGLGGNDVLDGRTDNDSLVGDSTPARRG